MKEAFKDSDPMKTGVGGSSNASAILSGIAALILAKHPSYSRSQILTSLIVSATGGGLRHDIGVWRTECIVCGRWLLRGVH